MHEQHAARANDTRADQYAAALLAARPGADATSWQRAGDVSAAELAWALKRACDAAWTTDPPRTRRAAELLAALAAREPDAVVSALAAWVRGIGCLSQGHMDAALHALDEASAAFAALGRRHEMAQTQVGRLMALSMLGRHDDAIACGATARAELDAAGDTLAAGKVELNLGNLAARRDQADRATRHFNEARQRFVAADEPELEIMAMFGLAEVHAQRHEFERAVALYEDARTAAQRGGFALMIASIDGDLGALEMRRGRYDHALRHLERSRHGYAELDVPHYLAVAEETLADAYLELNLLPEALALYERSLATYTAAGLVTDRAWALAQRGRALTLLGRDDAALDSLDAAAKIFVTDGNATGEALVAVWKSELLLRQGHWLAAAQRARDADATLTATHRRSWQLHARGLLAQALRGAGDHAQAEAVATAAAQDADVLLLAPAQRRLRLLLGLLARDRGDVAAARRCFEAVIESIESQRGTLPSEEFRAAFLGDNLVAYRELVRIGVEDADATLTLQWIERARARSLTDSIATNRDDDEVADAGALALRRLRRRLDHCWRMLARPRNAQGDDADRLLDEAHRLESELLEAGRRRALERTVIDRTRIGTRLDVATLHEVLAQDTALVEYFTVDDALHACVVAGGAVRNVPLPARLPQVQAMLEQLRFQTDTLRHGTQRLAHRMPELRRRSLFHLGRLHAAVWAPLAPLLGDRRAVVVPHGVLHYLPFAALHDGATFEIERRELCRAPSAMVLLHCLQRADARHDSALVLGYGGTQLPHVRAELQAVAARFAQAQLRQDAAASTQALRAAGASDVLHIACHAQFRHDNPQFSALHLADGAFTVRDAARLELHCALVTLSACETGVSAVMPGDELIGLTHAFICAGAARVLASLWTVQDDATASFMEGFYDRLCAGVRPGRALREAQLDALRAQAHPYLWAAFALHGGW